jgi:hypothetical protein
MIKQEEAYRREILDLRMDMRNLQVRSNASDNAEGLLRKAFHLEQNPYQFWKLL